LYKRDQADDALQTDLRWGLDPQPPVQIARDPETIPAAALRFQGRSARFVGDVGMNHNVAKSNLNLHRPLEKGKLEDTGRVMVPPRTLADREAPVVEPGPAL
jgi:hypothetical protein